MPGPPKTPTKLRILRGETRPSQINRHEPQPAPRGPEPPADLEERALEVWHTILRDFGHTEVIRSIDADTLRLYCDAVARYEQAAGMLRKSGPLIRGARGGELVRNPLHQIVRDNALLIRIFARELGLTPAARTGLQAGNDRKPGSGSTLERLRAKRAARA